MTLVALCEKIPSSSTTSSGPRYGAIEIDSFGVPNGSSLEPTNTVFPVAQTSVPSALALTHETSPAIRFGSPPTRSTNTKSSHASATNDDPFAHHSRARIGAARVISPNFSALALPSCASLVE